MTLGLPRHWRRHWGACLAAAAMVAPLAHGMDLLQAYRLAQDNDATLAAARAAVESARERPVQARAQLRPNVALNITSNHNDLQRTPQLGLLSSDQYTSYNHSLVVRQALFRKPLLERVRQADHIVDDAQANLLRESANMAVRLATAYFEALLAQDQLDLVLRQQASIQAQLEAARQAFQAGSGTRTDIDEAQARADMNLAAELEARLQMDVTRQQLQVLTKLPVQQLAKLDAARLPLQGPQPATLEEWMQRAEVQNADLLALKARIEIARSEVGIARAAHLPTLDAVAQWTRSGSEDFNAAPGTHLRNQQLGVQLSVPIFAGGGVESGVRQALAERLRAEETLEASRRELGVRLFREFKGVSEGVLKVRALEQAVRSAEQLWVSNQRSVEAGSRTLVDVLNAEAQWQAARRDLAQARYTYLLARLRLQALAGEPLEVAVAEMNGWLQPPAQP